MDFVDRSIPEHESELDPCCLREKLEKQKANSLRGKLRKFDRSNKRTHMKGGVFGVAKLLNRHTCVECNAPRDYPLLRDLRARLDTTAAVEGAAAGASSMTSSGGGDGDDEDDDDFGLDDEDEDGFISQHERSMREQFAAKAEEQQRLQELYGFGSHRFDSASHLQLSVQLGYPIVLHACDTSSPLSGHLDLALEALARRFVGTKFRRLYKGDEATKALLQLYNVPTSASAASSSSSGSLLVCFINGVAVTSCSNITEFNLLTDEAGAGDSGPLTRYLQHAGVLVEQLPGAAVINERVDQFKARHGKELRVGVSAGKGKAGLGSLSLQALRELEDAAGEGEGREEQDDEDDGDFDEDAGEEEEEENSYCGVVGCDRMYAHSHVGMGRAEGGGGFVFGLDQQHSGAEALAKDFYTKI